MNQDSNQKRERLRQLKSEVAEFHPLLEQLFLKLNNIRHVEYTHGPNEKGADFVLHKFDPTLGLTAFVGVIVKLGKIHQDFTDIERQIDECKMPRLIENGKRNTHLNEIWIVNNDSITNNAQEKIYNKFPATSIHFVDAQKLIGLIDRYAPYFWHQIPTPVGHYLLALAEKNDQLDRQSNLLALRDSRFYIDIDLDRIEEVDKKRKARQSPVDIYEEVSQNRVTLIEGDMGHGKSKLLRQIVDRLATSKSFFDTGRIPVFSTYRSFVEDHKGDVLSLIRAHLGKAYDHVDLESNEFVVLIDGLDEIVESTEEHIEKLSNLIESLSQNAHVRVVFTSRPLKLVDSNLASQKHVKRYSIRPLSTTKIAKFIEHICSNIDLSRRLIEDIKKSQLFKQLPQSPIAAILLSNLLAQNAKELPSNLTELYSKSMELMLGRWDIDKGLLTQKEYEASDRFCGELAKYLLENGLDRIAKKEAEAILSNYLGERNLGLDKATLFEKIVTRTGAFAQDTLTGTIFFRHRSFTEFLYARHMWRTDRMPIDSRVFDYYWSNVYFFYLGLQRDCPALIKEILAFPVTTEGERWLKIMNMGNYFLAGYASPYSVVEQNLYRLFVEAAKLYQDVKSGKTSTRLNEFSDITVLWLFQFLMRQGYGFEFFRKAIEGATISIDDDGLESQETKAFALYLLGLVGTDLGEEGPLQFLVDEYGVERLPLAVSVGLRLEIELREELGRSPLMKKHNKKLRKLLRGNRQLGSAVQRILKKPLNVLDAKKN